MAANGLADFINAYKFAPGEGLYVIGSSHGANVAVEAAAKGLKHKIPILIKLGGPFGYARMSAGIGEWYNVTGSGDDVQGRASVDCLLNCKIQQGAHNVTVQSGGHSTLWNDSSVRDRWWSWFTNQRTVCAGEGCGSNNNKEEEPWGSYKHGDQFH